MSQIFLKKNIYDKNGVLLLAKGQRTTEAVLKKLRTRVSFEAQTRPTLTQNRRNP